jgi:hypothetical protein
MPEECHHPDSALTSGAADAPIPANWRANELLAVHIFLTVRLNHIISIKGHSSAIRSRYNSFSVGTRLQDGYVISDSSPACDKLFSSVQRPYWFWRQTTLLSVCRRLRVWSRHYTTSRKVASSIPDGFIDFILPATLQPSPVGRGGGKAAIAYG